MQNYGRASNVPRFAFRIDEIEETGDNPTPINCRYDWIPSVDPGVNEITPQSVARNRVNYRWWVCDGARISEYRGQPPGTQPMGTQPPGTQPYQTYSVFYNGGFGFWVLRDNAISPQPDAAWQPLCFDHDQDGSSYLCSTGQHRTVAYRKADQNWLSNLLPDIHYRSSSLPHNPTLVCGLKGDLALFLALVALGIEKARLPDMLPRIFSNGTWHFQEIINGWAPKRGVIVYVHTYPPYTREHLTRYEKTNPYFC